MLKIFAHRMQLLEHAAFWLFIYLFIFDYHFEADNWLAAIRSTLLEVLTYGAIVYFNLLALIPWLLKKKRTFAYVLAVSAVVIGYIFMMRLTGLESQFYELGGWRDVFSMVLNTSLFLLISLLYWYFKQWQIERERHFILKNEKLEAELSFLRAQISPHFIFNTLNNVYALALQKHDNTAPMVAKLSALLRHILYEGNKGEVLLTKELDILRQYIDLHLLRKPRSRNVDFYAEGNAENWKIAPMLLINFVENAFKHSNMDQDENAWVKISSEINSEGQFLFSTENSIFPFGPQDHPGGIGLPNVRRQLELHYPSRYTLQLHDENNVFQVLLTLQLPQK